MNRRFLAGLTACLLLAACAAPDDEQRMEDAAIPAPSAPETVAPAQAALAAPDRAAIKANPARLKGMSADAVRALIGSPDFLRRERPAEVWQYYGRGCVLDLFLYGENGVGRVAHVDLRARGETREPDPLCLSSLFDSPRSLPRFP